MDRNSLSTFHKTVWRTASGRPPPRNHYSYRLGTSILGIAEILLPDLVIEQEDRTIFVDAKYKDHWETLQYQRWSNLENELRERHRDDLLQVLAYSTLSDNKATTVCLAYPCNIETWTWLKERGMVSNRAAIYAGKRKIDLAMVAIPMGEKIDEMISQLGAALA